MQKMIYKDILRKQPTHEENFFHSELTGTGNRHTQSVSDFTDKNQYKKGI